MKNICFVCPWMHVEGGLQRVSSNIMNELSNKYKITLCIISTSLEKPFYKLNKNIDIVHLNNAAFGSLSFVRRGIAKVCSYLPVGTGIIKTLYYPQKRIKPLRDFINKGKFDCVIGLSGDINILLACVKDKSIDCKFIGWQHNSFEDYFERKGYYYYGRKETAKKLYPNLNYIVTLTKKDCQKYKKEMNVNVLNIYNPLTFKVDKINDKTGKQLLFVGRLDWVQKGLNYLIEVAYEVFSSPISADWHLMIVGDGEDRSRLEDAFQKIGIKNYITMAGKKENVVPYYQQSDILLNTSSWEGFGLVITEAMECGVPVISFKTDGPSELIQNGKNGFLIEKFDTKSYAEKVLQLMRDVDLRAAQSLNARKTACCYNIKSIVSKWEKIIEE